MSGRNVDWLHLTLSAATVVLIGFTSTILVVLEGLRAIGATSAQQISCIASLSLGMAATTLYLSLRHRIPAITAWSTPGSALIATSAIGTDYRTALGAFMLAGLLMMLTGLVRPLERALERMPAAIAAAMLAGVLLKYVTGVPIAAVGKPALVVPLIIAFFLMRFWKPLYAVPAIAGIGLVLAYASVPGTAPPAWSFLPLSFALPRFDVQSAISLGVPLFLVTMASQNLPGFAAIRANGYTPPVSSSLIVTGLVSTLVAPFGGHAVNMAAITATLASGPDIHPDASQRWKVAIPYAAIYALAGLCAGAIVTLLQPLPTELVTTIAGLALFTPLTASMAAMTGIKADMEAALLTFLVTASGVTIFSVGSAFWGLLAGLAFWWIKRHVNSHIQERP
jgi:benzoate membrane transport protein